MNEKLSVNLTGKDAAKLLEGLAKDPQLRSEDDPSILAEEQFPTDHHALLQGKTIGSSSDNIITILQWEKQHKQKQTDYSFARTLRRILSLFFLDTL